MQPHWQLPRQRSLLRRTFLPYPDYSSHDVSFPTTIDACSIPKPPLTVFCSAAYVKGRNVFHSAGMSATLGRYAFGFMWAAVACYFIATVLLCAGGAASGSSSGGGRRAGMFSRNRRSTRNRGSFIDKETAVDGDRSSFTRA